MILSDGPGLYAAYLAALAERGAGNTAFRSAARSFLARWPDPADWACEPLPVRLSAGSGTRPFLNFLMLAGFLQPGYDYLLERKLPAVLRESKYHPIGARPGPGSWPLRPSSDSPRG